MSLSFWSRGQEVDFGGVARYLQRTEKDVRTMMQLMLQENALLAQKAYWADSDQGLVNEWGAAEFPQCSALNLHKTRSWRFAGFAGLDRCLAALRCRKPRGRDAWATDDIVPRIDVQESVEVLPARAMPSTVDRVKPEAPKQVAVSTGDFTFRLTQAAPARAEPAPKTLSKRPSESTTLPQIKGLQETNKRRAAAMSETETYISETRPGAMLAEAATMATAVTSQDVPSPEQSTAAVAAPSRSAVGRDEAATTAVVSTKEASGQGQTVAADTPKLPTATRRSLKATDREAALPADGMREVARLIDSMDSGVGDEELSPEQPAKPHDVTRIDGDIDMGYLGMSDRRRKFIRRFVEDYVAAFFEAFCYRVRRDDIAEALCFPAKSSRLSGLATSMQIAQFNAELRQLVVLDNVAGGGGSSSNNGGGGGGIDMASANTHFYTHLARKVHECHIYETDAAWDIASAYATAVFNRMLEDVHFLAFESSAGAAGQHGSRSAVARRMCRFQRVRYTGLMARLATMRYVQLTGLEQFQERIAHCGAAPVPTAPDHDDHLSEEDMRREMECPWSNVAMRDALHTLVMTTLPHATNESMMVAMQQAIEAYNMAIVDYSSHNNSSFVDVLNKHTEGESEVDPRVVDLIGHGRRALGVEQVGKLAQHLADQWFGQLRSSLLGALMADHQFRPVPLPEVRRWIFEDRSPGGQDVDFVLHKHLYMHFNALRVRISEVKWLYASAIATLHLIARIKQEVARTQLLDHVDVPKYTALFRSLVEAEIKTEERLSRLEAELTGLRLDLHESFGRVLAMLETHTGQRA